MRQTLAIALQQAISQESLYEVCELIFSKYELEFVSVFVAVMTLESEQVHLLATLKSHFEANGIGITVVIGYQHDPLLLAALDYAKVVCAGEISYLADLILLETSHQKQTLLRMLHQKLSRIDHDHVVSAKAFIENGCNALLAADALYVHRNTFAYRMNKFKQQSSLDLRDFHVARLFQLWLTLRKTL